MCRHINLITIASLLTPLTPTVEKWTSSVGGRRRKIDAIRRSIDRTLQKKMENNVQQSVKNVKSSTEIKSAASQIELFNADRVFRSNWKLCQKNE